MAIQVYYDEAKERQIEEDTETSATFGQDQDDETPQVPNLPKQLEVEIDEPSLPLLSNFVNEHRAVQEQELKQETQLTQANNDPPDLSVLKTAEQPQSQQTAEQSGEGGGMPDFSALSLSVDTTNQRLQSMEAAAKNAQDLQDLIQF